MEQSFNSNFDKVNGQVAMLENPALLKEKFLEVKNEVRFVKEELVNQKASTYEKIKLLVMEDVNNSVYLLDSKLGVVQQQCREQIIALEKMLTDDLEVGKWESKAERIAEDACKELERRLQHKHGAGGISAFTQGPYSVIENQVRNAESGTVLATGDGATPGAGVQSQAATLQSI